MIFYILRDGVPVAKLIGYTSQAANSYLYADYMAIGTHSYRVRLVDDDDNFTDSEELELTTTVRSTTVAPAARPQKMLTLELKVGGRPERSAALSLVTTSSYFDGRRYPAVTFSGFADHQWSFTYSASLRDYEQLEELVQTAQPIVVRGSYCKRLIGTVTALSPSYTPYSVDFTLTVSRCDYVEELPYD